MKTFRLIWVFFQSQLQKTAEYRGMILIWMFESFFFPFTVLLVWLTIAQSSIGIDRQIQSVINYYSLLPLVSILTGSWHGIFLAQEIRLGKFSRYLIRPIFPFSNAVANNLAEKVVKFFFIFPFILISHLIFRIHLDLSLITLILFTFTLISSAVTSFLIDTIIGLLAFWMDEVTSLENLADIADYTFGGKLAPIFLFPPLLQQVAWLLPFRYTMSFPLELITGTLSAHQIYFGLLVQLFWIVLFALTSNILWHLGIKKYAAVGG